jgi:hypothetical protein
MGEPAAPLTVPFRATLEPASVDMVKSFGIAHATGCAQGCCRPTVSVALGVDSELARPVVMLMDVDIAEQFAAMLERQIRLARGEKAN